MIQIKNNKQFLLLFCLTFTSSYTIAQNTIINEKQFNPKADSLEGVDSSLINSTTIINRINNIDAHIKAIDTKVAYINSDQTKKEKAEKDGWFTDMQRIKEELIMERTLLMSKLPQTQIK